jgi:homoserine kinase type II
MAVYTQPSDEELAALLARYDLGRPLSFKGIAEGVENSNFLLETEAGRFFLTIYEKRVARGDLPFFVSLMEHLAAAGFPAPRPMALRGGGFLTEICGKPAAIVSFLTGVSPRRPTPAHCRALGAALARLHGALSAFAGVRPNALGPEAWPALITPRLALAERLREGLAAQIQLDLGLLADWRSGLPRGIIHADLFPDNALFIGDAVSGVIDFYFACTDALAYDVAVCLNAWCFEQRSAFNITKGQALIAGYESVRRLTGDERAALPALARGAALRFFATRLADWADTPPGALVKPKDPLEYADKLEFHRRVVNAGDYGA